MWAERERGVVGTETERWAGKICRSKSAPPCRKTTQSKKLKIDFKSYTTSEQTPLAARPRTYILQTGSHDVSINPVATAPLRPTYSHVSPAFLTWHPDDGFGLLPHIVWTFRRFVSLQSAGGRFRFRVPPSGTTCLSTSHLRRHSIAVFRQRLKTFLFSRSYQDNIIWLTCYYYHSSLLSGRLWSLQ